MKNDWTRLPVEQLAPLIKNKELSSVELTKAVLKKAEKNNGVINAYIEITRHEALTMAEKADQALAQGEYKGMYHGIPIGIKDNIYMANKRTTMGSKIHQDYYPDFDASIIARLRNQHAVFIGKLNMHEYAHGPTNNNPHYGACKNPWDVTRIPGSSSGGSGAAVISGMASASIGTDTGGSIRIPASSCGIVGLKPTYGRVSKHGVFPLAWSLDHAGPMTKTVTDAAGMLEVIAGYDKHDSTSAKVAVDPYTSMLELGVEGLVIGINEDYFFKKVDDNVLALVKKQVSELEKRGAKIELVKLPAMKYSEYALMTTMIAEPAALHAENLRKYGEDYSDDVRTLLQLGQLIPAIDYLKAQQYRNLVKSDFQKMFEQVDVLITPTTPFVAPKIGNDFGMVNGTKVDLNDEVVRFTGPGNITGLPCLSLPCGLHDGLPVGLQIIGDAYDESTVLRVGKVIEENVDFAASIPTMEF